MTSRQGFTIVELLLVIVIIAILAAITLVAYNGISSRANASRAKANATNVLKVAAAYSIDDMNPNQGAYPTLAQLTGWTGGMSRLPSGVTVNSSQLSASTAGDGKTIQYVPKGITGGCIGYWDVTLNTYAYLYSGNATSGGNVATPTCA